VLYHPPLSLSLEPSLLLVSGGSGGYVEWQSGARVTAGTEKPKTFATLSLGSLSLERQAESIYREAEDALATLSL
jgi:hypothetical protein